MFFAGNYAAFLICYIISDSFTLTNHICRGFQRALELKGCECEVNAFIDLHSNGPHTVHTWLVLIIQSISGEPNVPVGEGQVTRHSPAEDLEKTMDEEIE